MTDRIGWHVWDNEDNWASAPTDDAPKVVDPYADASDVAKPQPRVEHNPAPTIKTAPATTRRVPVWAWWAATVLVLLGIVAGLLYTTVVDNGAQTAPPTVSPLPTPAEGAPTDAPADLPTIPGQSQDK